VIETRLSDGSLRALLVGVGISLTAVVAPARAESSQSISFELARGPGAELCPDHDSLAAQVEQRLAQSQASPHAPVADKVAVTIVRAGDAYVASLSILSPDGLDGGTRSLVDTGQDCAGLAEALSLTLAMIADGRPLFPAKPPEVVAPPPALVPPPKPTKALRPIPAAPAPPPIRRSWELGAGVLGASNLLGAPTIGYGVDAAWHPRPHLVVGVKGIWLPARTIQTTDGGQTKVSIEAGLARACWGILPFGGRFFPALCAELGAGVLQGSSQGYLDAKSATRPWLAAGASANAGISVSKNWSLAAQAGALFPLRNEQFTIGGLETPAVYKSNHLGWLAEIDVRVRIW
jgi:hypothetical protein